MFDKADYNIVLFWNPNPNPNPTETDPRGQLEIAHLFMNPACVHRTVKFYAFTPKSPLLPEH